MALINCPQCGKEISEKALECPSCGFKITNEDNEAKEHLKCEECGKEIPDGETSCSSCGCPINADIKEELPQKVEIKNGNSPKLDSNKRNKIIVVVAVILAIVGIAFAVNHQKTERYKSILKYTTEIMLEGAAAAEDVGGLVHDVWYNTIFEESDSITDKYTKDGYWFYDDFNDSLAALSTDSDFEIKVNFIKANREFVKESMKELTDPPRKYQEAYETLKDYYDAYLDLTNLVVNPSGNLQSYTSNYNDADSDVLKCYNVMQSYIE